MKPSVSIDSFQSSVHINSNLLEIDPMGSPNTFFSKPAIRLSSHGFSLVEMLVVLSIISILSILVSTSMQGIFGTAFDSETSDLANTLTRARAYAMANNTYVFVGIQEVDASQPSTGAQSAGTGRIGVTVVASNDGTRIYSTSAPSALTAAGLTVVSPLHRFEDIHMTTTSSIANLPNAGNGTSYNPASTSSSSATTFNWPLTGTAQYSSFGSNINSPGTVIQFNPQGEAQIVTGANTDSILQWIEIDLVPTHGKSTSGTTSKNPATILIDGASGSVSTYRA
jgi:prepilin-type N-terminal cleavage/methylation domain-containing protein